ncbi:MAG: type 1 glutamine amidotransferase [Pseudonocardia sp.]|nr:type 1 glutamine amidotransferase [Pseudonocardia sp.]
MRVLFVQHQADAPPGLVGDRLAGLGATIEMVQARAERLPDPAGFDLVVPLGSSDSAADESVTYLRSEWSLLERAVEIGIPVFGICFGAQLLCRVLGGQAGPMPDGPELGWVTVETTAPDVVAPGPWLTWHSDRLEPGLDSVQVARTRRSAQAFVHGPHLGVQFHPEATAGSVRAWVARYSDEVDRLGIDPDAVVADTRERTGGGYRLTDELVDRVLARAGLLPGAA